MKITVFGATGGVGIHVVTLALTAGHDVTAVVRDPARLDVPAHDRLEVAVADVMDPAMIAPCVDGREAVISALGPRDRGPTTVCRDGARGVIAAMRAVGTRRLVVVSNSGMHREGDGVFTRTVVKPLLTRVLGDAWADMRAMEEEVLASELDWTIVRPPRLTNGKRTGSIRSRVGANVRGGSISRADLADFVLRTAADEVLNQTSVSVAHG